MRVGGSLPGKKGVECRQSRRGKHPVTRCRAAGRKWCRCTVMHTAHFSTQSARSHQPSILNNWGYIFSPTINWFPWLCFSQWKKIILVIQSSLSSLLVAVIICSALPISQRVRSMQSRRRRWIRQRGAARCSTFKNLFPFHNKCLKSPDI